MSGMLCIIITELIYTKIIATSEIAIDYINKISEMIIYSQSVLNF